MRSRFETIPLYSNQEASNYIVQKLNSESNEKIIKFFSFIKSITDKGVALSDINNFPIWIQIDVASNVFNLHIRNSNDNPNKVYTYNIIDNRVVPTLDLCDTTN